MFKRFAWSLVLAITMSGLVACQGVSMPKMPGFGRSSTPPPTDDALGGTPATPAISGSGLAISTSQRFPDIPLPVGLKDDPERSFVYESSSLALGRMVYTSKSTVNELAQFFIDECPAADWQLDRVIQANASEMVFRKPGKRLDISIQDLGIGRGRRLSITMVPDTGP